MSDKDIVRSGNIRVKQWVDGSCDVLICSDNIFKSGSPFRTFDAESKKRRGGLEDDEIIALKAEILTELGEDVPSQSDVNTPSPDSIRRAQARLKELLLSNSFEWFITITLDAQAINRYEYGDIIPVLNKWLDNRVQRNGFKYVLVPEFHKDGAIHFHGVLSGDVKAVDSGTVKVHGKKKPVKVSTYERYYKGMPCSTVYNLTDWRHGFTTAVRLDDKPRAVARYISKYITKDSRKVGGRWYLSGGALQRVKPMVYTGNFFDFADVFRMFGIEGRRERFCAFYLSKEGEVFGTFVDTDTE